MFSFIIGFLIGCVILSLYIKKRNIAERLLYKEIEPSKADIQIAEDFQNILNRNNIKYSSDDPCAGPDGKMGFNWRNENVSISLTLRNKDKITYSKINMKNFEDRVYAEYTLESFEKYILFLLGDV